VCAAFNVELFQEFLTPEKPTETESCKVQLKGTEQSDEAQGEILERAYIIVVSGLKASASSPYKFWRAELDACLFL
jgi:hypothetical protein